MEEFELYSIKKAREERESKPVIYRYDIPREFRVQVIYIWNDAIGSYKERRALYRNLSTPNELWDMNWFWNSLVNELSRTYGLLNLGSGESNSKELCTNYLLKADTEKVLDMVLLSFHWIDTKIRTLSESQMKWYGLSKTPDEAIAELNHRFRQHSLGYRYENGQIVRIEDEYLYGEVTAPAIRFLSAEGFEGPSEEYLAAHEHYRKGHYDVAIQKASNAFESTIKTILVKREIIDPDDKSPANKLIRKFFDTDLIPKYLESAKENFINVMQELPTIRNKESAHGKGPLPTEVDQHVAAYALHISAAGILFLIQCHLASKTE
jgi:hypothetical protein